MDFSKFLTSETSSVASGTVTADVPKKEREGFDFCYVENGEYIMIKKCEWERFLKFFGVCITKKSDI